MYNGSAVAVRWSSAVWAVQKQCLIFWRHCTQGSLGSRAVSTESLPFDCSGIYKAVLSEVKSLAFHHILQTCVSGVRLPDDQATSGRLYNKTCAVKWYACHHSKLRPGSASAHQLALGQTSQSKGRIPQHNILRNLPTLLWNVWPMIASAGCFTKSAPCSRGTISWLLSLHQELTEHGKYAMHSKSPHTVLKLKVYTGDAKLPACYKPQLHTSRSASSSVSASSVTCVGCCSSIAAEPSAD